jgi:hypothetical protein
MVLTVEAIGDAWLSATQYNPKAISSTKPKKDTDINNKRV